MNADASALLEAAIDRDSRSVIRCLAAAERATLEGRLNIAKVLRAAALSARTRALALERIAAAETPSRDAFAAVVSDAAATRSALTDCLDTATGDERHAIEAALNTSQSVAQILTDAERSLATNRDILESDVAQFLWGCEDCGYITKDRADICPSCGSLASDWVLFAPFYSDTPEHISRRTPDSIVEQLKDDPKRFRAALLGVDEEVLRRNPSSDEWCAKEIAGHIVDVAELFGRRLRAVTDPELPVAPERTILPWALIEGQNYPDMPVAEIIFRFDRANTGALALIARLETADWRKKTVFAVGKVSVVDLGSWLANHNVAHLQQLAALLKP